MDIKRANTIADAVAQFNYYNDIIEKAKAEIRELTEKEVATINAKSNLHIARQDYTKTIYSNEYKIEVEKLKEKYPPTKDTLKNHTITLTLSNANVIEKASTIQEIAKQSKTQVKKLAASIQKEKRANKKK